MNPNILSYIDKIYSQINGLPALHPNMSTSDLAKSLIFSFEKQIPGLSEEKKTIAQGFINLLNNTISSNSEDILPPIQEVVDYIDSLLNPKEAITIDISIQEDVPDNGDTTEEVVENSEKDIESTELDTQEGTEEGAELYTGGNTGEDTVGDTEEYTGENTEEYTEEIGEDIVEDGEDGEEGEEYAENVEEVLPYVEEQSVSSTEEFSSIIDGSDKEETVEVPSSTVDIDTIEATSEEEVDNVEYSDSERDIEGEELSFDDLVTMSIAQNCENFAYMLTQVEYTFEKGSKEYEIALRILKKLYPTESIHSRIKNNLKQVLGNKYQKQYINMVLKGVPIEHPNVTVSRQDLVTLLEALFQVIEQLESAE